MSITRIRTAPPPTTPMNINQPTDPRYPGSDFKRKRQTTTNNVSCEQLKFCFCSQNVCLNHVSVHEYSCLLLLGLVGIQQELRQFLQHQAQTMWIALTNYHYIYLFKISISCYCRARKKILILEGVNKCLFFWNSLQDGNTQTFSRWNREDEVGLNKIYTCCLEYQLRAVLLTRCLQDSDPAQRKQQLITFL